jgi:AbrB family looped-hinge helix DNA binding protein
MRVSVDKRGRVVVPKPLRDELGLTAGTQLEIHVVDGHLELSASRRPAKLVEGRHGLSFAATSVPITDEDIRRTLEAVRERR